MAEVLTKPSRRITNMVAKELRLIVKDKVALFLIFLLPAALIGMLWWVTDMSDMGSISMGGGGGMGGMGSEDNATITEEVEPGIGLIDFDTTTDYPGEDLSSNFTAFLNQSTSNLIIYNNTDDAYRDLYEGAILGYVVIPDGFEANLTDNLPTYIEIHVDATALLDQAAVQGQIQAAVIMFRVSKFWIRSEVFPSLVIEFTPEGSYLAAVFGAFIVAISSYLGIAMTSAQSIVGDIPLRRMLLTPTNRLEVITAKVLAYVVIGFFQSLLLIALWVVAFDLNLNTGFETLVIIMSLTALTGSCTGIFISAVAGSRLQANQIFLFVMFASIILSGFFIEVGYLNEILPLNLGMSVLIDTAFKGLSLLDIWDAVARLLGVSVGLILASSFIFSKKPTLD